MNVSRGVPGKRLDALRMARSAPAVPLSDAAAAAGVTVHQLRMALRLLSGRGGCALRAASVCADTGMSGATLAAVEAHRACPPPALRARDTTPAKRIPGTAAWNRRGVSRRAWHANDLDESTAAIPAHRLRLAASAGLKGAAANPSTPPAALVTLAESVSEPLLEALAANPWMPVGGGAVDRVA